MSFDPSRILDHKWLDANCVQRGCQSLLLEQLLETSSAVVDLIEGFPGYGTCSNMQGRLKDQGAWVSFYVLVKEIQNLGYFEGSSEDSFASAMSTGTAKTPQAVEGQSPASAVAEGQTPNPQISHPESPSK